VPDTGGAKNRLLSGATEGLVFAEALQLEVVQGEAGAVVLEVQGIKEVLAVYTSHALRLQFTADITNCETDRPGSKAEPFPTYWSGNGAPSIIN